MIHAKEHHSLCLHRERPGPASEVVNQHLLLLQALTSLPASGVLEYGPHIHLLIEEATER